MPRRSFDSLVLFLIAGVTACPNVTGLPESDVNSPKQTITESSTMPNPNEPSAKTERRNEPSIVPDRPEPPAVALDPQTERAIAASINRFAVDFYRELARKPGNVFVSPASISIAFAMAHAGAKGETRDQLTAAFHYPPRTVETGFAGMLARWNETKPGVELGVANRLFGEQTVKFEPAFLAATAGAGIEPLDFKSAPDPSRAHINAWVAEQTHDKIRDLLPPSGVTSDTRLVLVNAVYFKAQWLDPFLPAATKPAVFHGQDGDESVQMMARTGFLGLGVAKEANARLVELPYGDGEYAMVIVLPDDPDGLLELERVLSADTLRKWIEGASMQRVELQLPRFRIEPGDALTLRAPLEQLGVLAAFDATQADFTGIAPRSEQLVISEAFHKAFVSVDEAGTEAAAATALSMRAGSAPPTAPPIRFVVDHPFLFLIRETRSGAILFVGRLTDP